MTRIFWGKVASTHKQRVSGCLLVRLTLKGGIARLPKVRLRGSQLSSQLVEGVTHLVLSNVTSGDKPADARKLLQLLADSGVSKETLSWLKRQLLRGEVVMVSRR